MKEKQKKFKYSPLSLKEILREMKKCIDLMFNLAYGAVAFGSRELAEETFELEQKVHEYTFLLIFQIIQTHPGSDEERKSLEPIALLGYSIDKISDALSDISKVPAINDISPYLQQVWSSIPELIVKVKVSALSPIANQSRTDVHFRSQHSVDLIAIRRGQHWLFGNEEKLLPDDILIVEGELPSIMALKQLCQDAEAISYGARLPSQFLPQESEDFKEDFLSLVKDLIQIIDISETMVDLAFAALFFQNTELAEDVIEMEDLVDGLNVKFERDLLYLAQEVQASFNMAGFLRIVFSCELIADAAASIAENLLKGFKPHPIFSAAIQESNELVVREQISPKSFFQGKTYASLQIPKFKKGFYIIALKRNNDWIYKFKPDFTFQQGDILVGLGPSETIDQWRRCVNPESAENENRG